MYRTAEILRKKEILLPGFEPDPPDSWADALTTTPWYTKIVDCFKSRLLAHFPILICLTPRKSICSTCHHLGLKSGLPISRRTPQPLYYEGTSKLFNFQQLYTLIGIFLCQCVFLPAQNATEKSPLPGIEPGPPACQAGDLSTILQSHLLQHHIQ